MKIWTKVAAYLGVGGLAIFFAARLSRTHAQAIGAGSSTSGLWLALLIVSILIVGVLCVLDVKQFVKTRAEGWMLQAGVPDESVPELEEAKKVRAAGEPLDAIRLLREYLQANPYEIHVMSRIAEIYRYDLNNDLAAALEYEEMLKHKLPDDQWAWAALHLAKLYGRLNELEKSVTLLERLDTAYGHTIAGKRAKKALEQVRDPGAPGDEDDSVPGEA